MHSAQPYTLFVALVMFGWIPAVLGLFAALPSRRAVIAAFVLGWLFLPMAEYEIRLVPDYTKTSATCLGVFCATLMFDSRRIFQFRPRWFDVPVAVLSFCPMGSSIVNGLGVYDGFSESFAEVVRWGLPYFLGRIYFDDLEDLRELAIGVFLGGLIYVPLCLWEIKMSPHLHVMVYGFRSGAFHEAIRLGGYRPTVFMQTGLMVGMWMTVASLCGFWLWHTRSLEKILGVPVIIPLILLAATAALCRSAGAMVLLAMGMAALMAIKYSRTSLPILGLAAVSVLFILIRASGAYDARQLADTAGRVFGADRGASLRFRMLNNDQLSAKARQKLPLGWGGWGRSRVRDDRGRDTSVTDSFWVIKFGTNGAIGLCAFIAAILLPALLLRFRLPPEYWSQAPAAAAVAAAAVLCLWMIDNLFNAMINPVYILMMGGLSGLAKVAVSVAAPAAVEGDLPAEPEPEPSQRELIEKRREAVKKTRYSGR